MITYYQRKFRLTSRFWRLLAALLMIIISMLVLKYTTPGKIIVEDIVDKIDGPFATSNYWDGVI